MISAAAAVTRCSGLVVVRARILAIGAATVPARAAVPSDLGPETGQAAAIDPAPEVAASAQAPDKGQAAASGPVPASGRAVADALAAAAD